MTARVCRSMVCWLLRRIRVGSLQLVEGEQRHVFGSGPPAATIDVRSDRLWPMLLRGSRGLADAYAAGLWDSPDLVAVIRVAARNADRLDRARARFAPVRWPLQRARAALTRNTKSRSRRGISAHYDLGNELFKRMLDPTMSYSCAIFDERSRTLEEASLRKLELVCEKLGLAPGDRVLEIGTGWGSFAVYAAATRGCHVTTTTISSEQFEYARRQVRERGLGDRVTVLMQDYRDLEGRFDKLVSIEMIEAVGWQHIGKFLHKCSELLEDDGSMLLQAITIDDRAYEVEKASRSFINTHIFPGGCLPSLEILSRNLARRTDMQTVGLEDITAHYVPTLRHWRRTFEAHGAELERLGYDARFRRLWTLYLCYCEAGFAERRICDVQLLLAKPRWVSSLSAACDLGEHAGPPARGAHGVAERLHVVGALMTAPVDEERRRP
jgi:cyclopropane-fatty-acyl-phospholipid synthase